MKIQIINCLPLEYPYQVTRMKKKMSHVEIDYFTQEEARIEHCDATILIAKKMNETLKAWCQCHSISLKQVIVMSDTYHEDVRCWVLPKAFEKEFDIEKLVQYVSSIVEENPIVDLFQNVQLKLMKVHKETTLKETLAPVMKTITNKEKVSLHVLIKEKAKRLYPNEELKKNIQVHQHWVRGIDSEVEVLIIKRKS